MEQKLKLKCFPYQTILERLKFKCGERTPVSVINEQQTTTTKITCDENPPSHAIEEQPFAPLKNLILTIQATDSQLP